MNNIKFIEPDWPAPINIKAYTTTRNGGISVKPFNSFNLAYNTNDDQNCIKINRNILNNTLKLPSNPVWLDQIHSNKVISASPKMINHKADASFTEKNNIVCTILTADCMPILLTDKTGSFVAAIHAGWRGFASEIIKNTIKKLNKPSETILAWLGPAIGKEHFIVGNDVHKEFINKDKMYTSAFVKINNEKWNCNLIELAKQQLQSHNIFNIYGGNYCTYKHRDMFFSYRRDKGETGRMATIIWISDCWS